MAKIITMFTQLTVSSPVTIRMFFALNGKQVKNVDFYAYPDNTGIPVVTGKAVQ